MENYMFKTEKSNIYAFQNKNLLKEMLLNILLKNFETGNVYVKKDRSRLQMN